MGGGVRYGSWKMSEGISRDMSAELKPANVWCWLNISRYYGSRPSALAGRRVTTLGDFINGSHLAYSGTFYVD